MTTQIDKGMFLCYNPEIYLNMQYRSPENDAEVIPRKGETYVDAMQRMLITCLSGTFKGGTIVEVGAWDGKNINVVRAMGAGKVIALEPLGIVDQTRLAAQDELKRGDLASLIQDNGAEKFDGFVAFNCAPSNNNIEFIYQLYQLLKSDGVGVITFAEEVRYKIFSPLLHRLFSTVEIIRMVGSSDNIFRPPNGLNGIIIKVGNKNPNRSLEDLK